MGREKGGECMHSTTKSHGITAQGTNPCSRHKAATLIDAHVSANSIVATHRRPPPPTPIDSSTSFGERVPCVTHLCIRHVLRHLGRVHHRVRHQRRLRVPAKDVAPVGATRSDGAGGEAGASTVGDRGEKGAAGADIRPILILSQHEEELGAAGGERLLDRGGRRHRASKNVVCCAHQIG